MPGRPGRELDSRIAHIIVRMEETLAAAPRIADLAAAVQLSPSRLAHLFRDFVGVPPGRYLHAIRMQHARALLERSFLSVKEVMARVGINDPSHFARDFRKYHGIAPSQVRRGGDRAAQPPGSLLTHLERAADQRQRVVDHGGPVDRGDATRGSTIADVGPRGPYRPEE